MNTVKNEQLAAMAKDLRDAPTTSMIGTHVMLPINKGAAIAIALEMIIAERAATWVNPTTPPDVKSGECDYFWIAVLRKGADKVFTFPALYCNEFPLCSDYPEDISGQYWSQVAVDPEKEDGDIKVTGWYDAKSGDGDYDTVYERACGEGDVILAWHRGPEYPV